MKATLTSKGQITLPVELRRRLDLKAGDVLEFDENVPYLKAHKPFNRDDMLHAIGRGLKREAKQGGKQLSSAQWIKELRGPVELP